MPLKRREELPRSRNITQVPIKKILSEDDLNASDDHDFMPVPLEETTSVTAFSLFKAREKDEPKAGCSCLGGLFNKK